MEYAIDHALNHAIREHALLVSIIAGFAGWGVLAFGIVACGLWLLDPPRRPGVWRQATAAGLAAATLALGANQLVTLFWQRPRPFTDHPLGVLPLITSAHDASFPSDHASLSFAIAFGILFVAGRSGWLFVAWAALIACSRVLAGVHYPTDVLAGALIGLGCGYFTARLALPLLARLIAVVSRVTDPVLGAAATLPPVREIVASAALRRAVVIVAGALLLARFAFALRHNLLDEMPLAALAAWVCVVALVARIAGAGGERTPYPR
jgi:undecaprenyl-diphosphatase